MSVRKRHNNSLLHSNQEWELFPPSIATLGAIDCFVTIEEHKDHWKTTEMPQQCTIFAMSNHKATHVAHSANSAWNGGLSCHFSQKSQRNKCHQWQPWSRVRYRPLPGHFQFSTTLTPQTSNAFDQGVKNRAPVRDGKPKGSTYLRYSWLSLSQRESLCRSQSLPCLHVVSRIISSPLWI